MRIIKGEELEFADLIVDATYEGVRLASGKYADPLNRLVKVSNQGGFRYRGTKGAPALIVLTSNFAEPDWPDELDVATGRFVYYGDNRHPGRDLHATGRFGNQLLRRIFDDLHSGNRHLCPPILIFSALRTRRAFVFRGLAAPGFPGTPPTQDLVAVWKSTQGHRFQNYKATFTVLDAQIVSRNWILSAVGGLPLASGGPNAWKTWVQSGRYVALQAAPASLVRSRIEQLPENRDQEAVLNQIRARFAGRAVDFEACAAEISKLLLRDVVDLELTRPWRDGGRDAIGKVRLGRDRASIRVTFALEAKCYGAGAVGVAEMSRLISRLRYREFGILVTTSYVNGQAYKEIVDDGHPVIIVCGRDIAKLLADAGYSTIRQVEAWLDSIDQKSDRTSQVNRE